MRTLLRGLLWTAAGFLAGLLLASTVPNLLGYRTYSVRSGSMTPAIRTGDVVAVAPIAPLQAHVGEIIAFRDPLDPSRLYNHRVRAMSRVGARVVFTTQGDDDTTQEHWSVPVDGQIGRVIYRVPMVGFVLMFLASAPGKIALTTIPALGLLAIILTQIWKPSRRRVHQDAQDA